MRVGVSFDSWVVMMLLMGAVVQGQEVTAAQPVVKAEAYGKLPLSFEANQGQTDPQVRFLSRGNGYSLFLTDSAAVLSLRKGDAPRAKPGLAAAPSASIPKTDVVRMELAGASRGLRVEGAEKLPGTANYFIGNDPAKWRSAVPTYAKVRYAGVYPGVDLVYYGNQSQLEYDFVVAPHADPKPIRLHFAGASKLKLDPNGDLEVIARNGQIAFHKPVVYQEIAGKRQPVEGSFSLLAKNVVSFRLGSYDREKAVVIDPVLAYSTYLGGSGYHVPAGPECCGEVGASIATDIFGHAYITGSTGSTDFPVTGNAFQKTNKDPNVSSGVAFVTKFSADGSSLVYSTYLGGTGDYWYKDAGQGIAVDAFGDAYVTGYTGSTNFPTTSGALQTTNKASVTSTARSAFVTKLSPDGTILLYSTYFGGTGFNSGVGRDGESGTGIAVDGNGNAFITGNSYSKDLPLTTGAFQTTNNALAILGSNPFVAEINATGSALIYSTYLGGSGVSTKDFSGADYATGIAVDINDNAYVTGYAHSKNFPTTPGAFQVTNKAHSSINNNGAYDTNIFVSKLNLLGTGLLYSTYIGGSGGEFYGDTGSSVAVDSYGSAYVTGAAISTDFPITTGAFQVQNNDAANLVPNAFISKVNGFGTALVYSTFLGGSGYHRSSGDSAAGIAVDSSGDAFVTGTTYSSDFPVTSDAFQKKNNQYVYAAADYYTGNAFLTELNPTGTGLLYSTYFGGSGQTDGSGGDIASAIALDPAGSAYLIGTTRSINFPVTIGSFQTVDNANKAGNPDATNAFIAKFGPVGTSTILATTTSITSNGNPQVLGATVAFTAHVTETAGLGVPTGSVYFSADSTPGTFVPLDSTGSARFVTSSLVAGTHTVTASYYGDADHGPSSGTVYELIVPGPLSITIVSGAGQSATVGTPLLNPIVVQVKNGLGVPVPGATVTFASSGLKFLTGTVVTTALGQAIVTATPVLAGVLNGVASVFGTPFVLFTENGVATPISTPPGFASMAYISTGASAAGVSLQVVAADFNGDGYPDLATTNNVDASVSVLLGKGNGTFQSPVTYGTGNGPYGVVAGDFNGDGKPDLAVVNGLDNTVSILLNSAGSFPAKPSFTYSVGSQPYGVSMADFNHDGFLDLVVTNNASKTLSVLLGKGDGSFSAAVSYATGNYPFGTAVADFNNDGYPDLVVWNLSDNTVGVLLNTKAGTFLPQVTYATGADPYGVVTGDFNGDGYPDLAVADLGGNTVSVLLNNKAGGFLARVSYPAGTLPSSVLARDLNGDGVLDLATTNLGDGTVSVLLGKGDGTFLTQTVFAAGTQPYSLLAADFNGDGKPDLAVTSFFENTLGVLLQTSSGTSGRMKAAPPKTLKTVPAQ